MSIGYSRGTLKVGVGMLPRVPSSPFQVLKSDWREVLARKVKESGKSKREVSLEAGLNHSAVSEWLRKKKPKHPSFAALAKVASVLKCSLDSFAERDHTLSATRREDLEPSDIRHAPVVGYVQAGAWHEPEMFDISETTYVPLVQSPEYRGITQYAWRVVGPSINRIADDGAYVIGVRFDDVGRAPRDGEYVICERHRHGVYEYTVKRVRLVDRGVQLVPDSTDSRFQEPVWLSDGEKAGVEVRATHLLIGVYRPL